MCSGSRRLLTSICSLKVHVFRKPTHTDQYLQFDSAHPLEHKLSVVHTLYHQAYTVVSQWDGILKEKEHVAKALSVCGYLKWALEDTGSGGARRVIGEQKERKCQGRVTIPYIQSVSEITRVLGSVNITTHFRPPGTLRRGIREALYMKRVVPWLNKIGGLCCALSPVWAGPLTVKSSSQ